MQYTFTYKEKEQFSRKKKMYTNNGNAFKNLIKCIKCKWKILVISKSLKFSIVNINTC